jgi:uncharacterized protein (DUF433 family)
MENALQRITVNPEIAFGKPTIRGTRYSVQWLLELLSSGMTNEEILADYEDLEVEDIQAVSFLTRIH